MADFTELATGIVYPIMKDEHELVNITEKEVTVGDIGVIVCGDIKSQEIEFQINRFYDDIDMIDKDFYIIYQNKGGVFKSKCVDISYNDDFVRFNWLLDEDATLYPGKLKAAMQIVGKNEKNELYSIKTKNFEINVCESLNEYGQEGIYNSWANTVEELLGNINDSLSSASTSFVGTYAEYLQAESNGAIYDGMMIVITDL